MMEQPELPEASRGRSSPPASPYGSLVLRVLSFLGAALLGAGLASTCRREPDAAPQVVQVVRPTPDVITAVRDLARLESTAYHVERVVDLRDRQQLLGGMVQAEDAILLVAAGDVIAGVDLQKLRPEDIEVDPTARRVRITLPPPEILSAALDNGRTFVYSRDTDTLARRSETLETRARQEAERTLRQAALEAGVLSRAGRQASSSIETLVRGLGYPDVQVRIRSDER